MAFLGRALKVDLKCLAEELGETATEDMRVTELKKIILASTEYEEEFVKELLKRIVSGREEIKRQQKEDEIRRQEYEIKQQEREDELKRREQEREDELKRQEKEYELERLKIEASLVHTGTIGETSSSRNEETREHVSGGLQKLMRTFDPKEGDISFYLILFERQARRVHIKEEDWVTHLVGLLPLEMANLIAREPEEKANDYKHVKCMLLKRFKLSPEAFKIKFKRHCKT
ncbi:gelsolin-related protein of 125 kDa-like, partial [Parasteatoda tepidariorum]|uniref:gelsolin-related protein of 125 kDa-like n=1 Tax=Parasteatoda tepidariorum TaxID=114398 RepID=UPI0039BCBFFC